MAQMSLVLQDVFTSLKTGFWAGCPALWSVKVNAGLQYPSGHFCASVTPLSWQPLPFAPSCPQHFIPKTWQQSLQCCQPPSQSEMCYQAGPQYRIWMNFLFIVIQMVEILLHYTDRTLKKCPDQGKIQVMEQHFQVWCSRGLLQKSFDFLN